MPTLLVIDDNEFAREVLKTTLEKCGYAVLVASGGEEGLRLAESQPVDAAIVDIYMPGMDGFVACGNLQALARERDRPLPVWLITGSYSAEAAARGIEVGALDVLRKPVNFADLCRRIEGQCGKRETGNRKPETGEQTVEGTREKS
jgi:CheY-like chemotaxis protein